MRSKIPMISLTVQPKSFSSTPFSHSFADRSGVSFPLFFFIILAFHRWFTSHAVVIVFVVHASPLQFVYDLHFTQGRCGVRNPTTPTSSLTYICGCIIIIIIKYIIYKTQYRCEHNVARGQQNVWHKCKLFIYLHKFVIWRTFK